MSVLDMSIADIIFSLFVTVFVYSSPIIIYRYFIRKRPLGKGKSILVALGYGFVSAILMFLLLASVNGDDASLSKGASGFWFIMNFFMLTRPSKWDKDTDEINQEGEEKIEKKAQTNALSKDDKETIIKDINQKKEETVEDKQRLSNLQEVKSEETVGEPKRMFCRKCGKKIPLDSVFCTYCGEKTKTVE